MVGDLVARLLGIEPERRSGLAAGLIGLLALTLNQPIPQGGGFPDFGAAQGDIYAAQRGNANTCSLYFPLFVHNADGWSSSVQINNPDPNAVTVEMRLRPLGGIGDRTVLRNRSLLGGATVVVKSAELGLGESFTGSMSVSACPHDVSAVLTHERAAGDFIALEPMEQPTSDLYFPGILNDVPGVTSRIVLLNTHRSADAPLTVTFRATGEPPVERSVFLPRDGSVDLDLTSAPKGLIGIRITGRDVKVVGAVFTYGPGTVASASNAVTTGSRRISFPLLYRRAGPDGLFESGVRVMNIREGGTEPRITFIDQETYERVGPFPAPGALQQGEVVQWLLGELPGLVEGHTYAAIAEVDTTEPLVGTAFTASPRGIELGYRGVTVGDTELTAPIVYRSAGGLESTIHIHNPGTTDASATITFRNQRGTRAGVWSGRVHANQTVSVQLVDVRSLPDTFTGSAVITGTVAVSGLVTTLRQGPWRGRRALTPPAPHLAKGEGAKLLAMVGVERRRGGACLLPPARRRGSGRGTPHQAYQRCTFPTCARREGTSPSPATADTARSQQLPRPPAWLTAATPIRGCCGS